jgi:hypothetical protein
MKEPLPHPADIQEVRNWLFLGAPAAHRDYNAAEMVKILIELVEALPSHHKVYCWGTHEHVVAMMTRELEGIRENLDQEDPPEVPQKTKDRIAFLEAKIAERSALIDK